MALIPCTSLRASGPVIHRESPVEAAVLPSSVEASFRVTKGSPVTTHLL